MLDRLIEGGSPLLSRSLLPVALVAVGTDEVDSEDWEALNGDACIGEEVVNVFISSQKSVYMKTLRPT